MDIAVTSFRLLGPNGMKFDTGARPPQETAKARNAVGWPCGFIRNRCDNLNDVQMTSFSSAL
jgi:hypothetical protein